jgi:transposase
LGEIVASWRNGRPLRLMFQDEARFGRISDTRSCWCRRPARPLVKAMVTQQYTYAYGAVSPQDGCFDSLVLPHVNTECMQIFLDEIARRHPDDNVVMVLDGAGWHKSKDFHLPENLRLLFLPPYSPELNPQEHLWDELREKYFHNRVFDSIDTLEDHLVAALLNLENAPARVKGITAWDWIINAASIAN